MLPPPRRLRLSARIHGWTESPLCREDIRGLTLKENVMIRFYFHPTPNPAKVALFLEETGLRYEAVALDTSKGQQHLPAFRAVNPNGKVPAIVDTDGPGGTEARVFDSNAILLYLGDKSQRFIG